MGLIGKVKMYGIIGFILLLVFCLIGAYQPILYIPFFGVIILILFANRNSWQNGNEKQIEKRTWKSYVCRKS